MRPIFLFGTLRHDPVRRIILGGDYPARPAKLAGHEVREGPDGDPLLVPNDDATATGLLVEIDGPACGRLDWYEAAYGYARRPVTVRTEGGPVEAEVYDARLEADPGPPWTLEGWVAAEGEVTEVAAAETMDHYGAWAPAELAEATRAIYMRAEAAVRARREAGPDRRGGTQVESHARPWTGFFSVIERRLRFRRYDGAMSEPVTRSGLHSFDAVTVLPYDPARDRVLIVEQFRFGPHMRGDPAAWILEPVAGHIDPGEDAETAARREAREEAGIELGRLFPIADYYPSPGGLSEYLYSYVGLCDLPDGEGGVNGLDVEVEDIRSRILPRTDALALIGDGAARAAPLILSLLWLDANRGGLA